MGVKSGIAASVVLTAVLAAATFAQQWVWKKPQLPVRQVRIQDWDSTWVSRRFAQLKWVNPWGLTREVKRIMAARKASPIETKGPYFVRSLGWDNHQLLYLVQYDSAGTVQYGEIYFDVVTGQAVSHGLSDWPVHASEAFTYEFYIDSDTARQLVEADGTRQALTMELVFAPSPTADLEPWYFAVWQVTDTAGEAYFVWRTGTVQQVSDQRREIYQWLKRVRMLEKP